MASERRQRQVHVAGSVAGATAAAASAPFGAAKLRDSFKESYPGRFTHGLGHLERVAQHRGLSQQTTSRILRVASRGKPGFVPLATASTAAAAAGGARRYERHLERKTVRKSAFGVEAETVKHDPSRRRGVAATTAGVAAVTAGAGTRRHAHSIASREYNTYGATSPAWRHAEAADRAHQPWEMAARIHHVDQLDAHLRDTDDALRRAGRLRVGSRAATVVGAGLVATGAGQHLRRKVRKSAFGVDLGKAASHRTETAAAGGGALAVYGANRSGRAARGHLTRAADLDRVGNAEFHAAHAQGQVVAQRLSRHVGTGAGSLPRTAGNLANTGHAHATQQAHLQRGLGAADESRSAAAAGERALRNRRGKLVLAGGLATTAAAAHRSRRY